MLTLTNLVEVLAKCGYNCRWEIYTNNTIQKCTTALRQIVHLVRSRVRVRFGLGLSVRGEGSGYGYLVRARVRIKLGL